MARRAGESGSQMTRLPRLLAGCAAGAVLVLSVPAAAADGAASSASDASTAETAAADDQQTNTTSAGGPAQPAKSAPSTSGQIVVTASRLDMLGNAATASQGVITAKEVELRPIY